MNIVTVVTIGNHLASFLITNKEDENKSNHNNNNNNNFNNNIIIQIPNMLGIDYDFNELISINKSVEKICNQISNIIKNN